MHQFLSTPELKLNKIALENMENLRSKATNYNLKIYRETCKYLIPY